MDFGRADYKIPLFPNLADTQSRYGPKSGQFSRHMGLLYVLGKKHPGGVTEVGFLLPNRLMQRLFLFLLLFPLFSFHAGPVLIEQKSNTSYIGRTGCTRKGGM